jgi:hypothetical protein
MADRVIENLITRLTFDFDSRQLESFNDFLSEAAKGLTAIVAGASAAAAGIFAFSKTIADTNDELGKLSQRLGVDLESLQELGFVAELNGASIDQMNSSLQNLNRVASEAARGVGEGVETFGLLGVSVLDTQGKIKTADELFLNISDSILSLGTQAEKLDLSQKLGIDENVLLLLQSGSEEINAQRESVRKYNFVVGKEATKAAADFIDSLSIIGKIISGISSKIATGLIKQIQPFLELLIEWFVNNRNIIKQNISSFIDGVVKAIRVLTRVSIRVASAVNSISEAMGGWKATIIAVSGLLLAMNARALLMPVLAAAAATSILLILEDLITFANGGDSAIGSLAEKFPTLDKALRVTLDLIKMSIDGWVLIFTQGGEALEGLKLIVQDLGIFIFNFFKDTGERIQNVFDKTVNGIKNLLSDIPVIRAVVETVSKTIDDVEQEVSANGVARTIQRDGGGFSILEAGENAIQSFKNIITDNPVTNTIREFLIDPISTFITGGESISQPREIQSQQRVFDSSLTQNTSSVANTNNTTNNNPEVNITINGGDTEEVRQTITDVLKQQYRSAQTNLESKVEF